MKKSLFGSALVLGCMVAAWADLTEDDIEHLRQEAWQKVRILQTYLEEVESLQDRQALINMAFGYVCLYDMAGASNAAEVLRMPYIWVISDFERRWHSDQIKWPSMRIDLTSGTRRNLVQQYAQRGELNPSHRLQELLGSAHMKRDWDPPLVPAIPPNVDEVEFQRCYEIMGTLREAYWEAKLNPEQVVLPLGVTEPFTYPTGIAPYEDEDQQTPNETFFVSWFQNVYTTLTKEWDEEVRDWGDDIPTWF
ncbi:MAG: hypothetical protein LBD54_01585 [Puniceicoccales bacterium]|nr:hypothetical protein [Puniceicoccales bacterium]